MYNYIGLERASLNIGLLREAMHWQFGEMEFGEMKRNTSNWSNFGMLSRRAGLTASAALSCLTCNNRLPYNLYCVGGAVKHCSLTHSVPRQRLRCPMFADVVTDDTCEPLCQPEKLIAEHSQESRLCIYSRSWAQTWAHIASQLGTSNTVV